MPLNLCSQGNNFTAEFKLLCFFFYFSVGTIYGLTVITTRLGSFPQNQKLYNDYFQCEAFGVDLGSVCVLEVDGHRDQALSMASNAMFIFAPYIILIYIIPVEKTMERLRIWRNRLT